MATTREILLRYTGWIRDNERTPYVENRSGHEELVDGFLAYVERTEWLTAPPDALSPEDDDEPVVRISEVVDFLEHVALDEARDIPASTININARIAAADALLRWYDTIVYDNHDLPRVPTGDGLLPSQRAPRI